MKAMLFEQSLGHESHDSNDKALPRAGVNLDISLSIPWVSAAAEAIQPCTRTLLGWPSELECKPGLLGASLMAVCIYVLKVAQTA